MMYALSIYFDGTMELFDIKDSEFDDIVENLNLANSNSLVNKTLQEVSIHRKNVSTTYFYNKEDRKTKILGLL